VKHSTPNCESFQDYKGIYSDRSTGVFNGKCMKEAQNKMRSKNNILWVTNLLNAKPQLEILLMM
jgi:Fe-S cluster assembly protein SufD